MGGGGAPKKLKCEGEGSEIDIQHSQSVCREIEMGEGQVKKIKIWGRGSKLPQVRPFSTLKSFCTATVHEMVNQSKSQDSKVQGCPVGLCSNWVGNNMKVPHMI